MLIAVVGFFAGYRNFTSERTTPSVRRKYRFPSRSRLHRLAEDLRNIAHQVHSLEFEYHPSIAVLDEQAFHRMVDERTKLSGADGNWVVSEQLGIFSDVVGGMRTYASVLDMWHPPRSDSIRVFGLIAPCIYAEIATGKPQYETVSLLLSCCSDEPLGSDLRKRLKYFKKSFPNEFQHLKSQLDIDHQGTSYYSDVDLESLLTKLEKSR